MFFFKLCSIAVDDEKRMETFQNNGDILKNAGWIELFLKPILVKEEFRSQNKSKDNTNESKPIKKTSPII